MANHRVFGSIDEYDSRSVEWELYEAKFTFFLEANLINDDKQKRAMLLASVGTTALGYVRDLNVPKELHEVDYKNLLEQLRAHYGKKTAMLAARNDFAYVRQKDGQSVEDFAAALRAASLLCKYGADLDVRLRDQLVIGLREDSIRKRLMEADENISFADALKRAADLERISRESKLGRGEASVSQLARLGGSGGDPQT